jgi:hypothetical protein
MQEIGQLHTPSALLSEKYPPLLNEQETGWTQSRCESFGKEIRILLLPWIELRFSGRPSRIPVVIPTTHCAFQGFASSVCIYSHTQTNNSSYVCSAKYSVPMWINKRVCRIVNVANSKKTPHPRNNYALTTDVETNSWLTPVVIPELTNPSRAPISARTAVPNSSEKICYASSAIFLEIRQIYLIQSN